MMIREDQRGFSMLELLIVLGIAGFIMGTMSMSINMIMKVNQQSNDRILALHEVQNVGYWISRDVLMSQIVITDEPGIFLKLYWNDGEGTRNEVDYLYEGDKLKRKLNGGLSEILIAEYIVEADTNLELDAEVDNHYKLTVKASYGEVEVERTYEVAPRSGLN